MVGYRVEAKGVARVLAKLGPDLYLPAAGELVRSAALLAERTARQGAPRDTAALARSITSEVKPLSARVYSTLSYAVVMEEGRAPGRPPPPQALVGWMARHGMTGDPWRLARAIGRRGLKGRFFMRAAAAAVTSALPGLAAQAARRVEARWGAR